MTKKQYTTLPELARLLGISHVAVWKRVKKGEIRAEKIGNTYVITDKELAYILVKKPTAKDKGLIERAVKKVVKDYGEVLKRLSKE